MNRSVVGGMGPYNMKYLSESDWIPHAEFTCAQGSTNTPYALSGAVLFYGRIAEATVKGSEVA